MAWDDPMVWILIVGLGILLFGSNKIPELARTLGSARREFDAASKGLVDTINSEINPIKNPGRPQRQVNRPGAAAQAQVAAPEPSAPADDALLMAARNEGIDTRGKSRTQIASELAAKVKDEDGEPTPS